MWGAWQRRLRGVVRWVFGTFETLIERLVAVGFIQSGVVLAAQTFLALFPLLIAVVALAPAAMGTSIAGSLRTRFGISGSTDEMVDNLVDSRTDLRGGITVFGAIVVLAAATSFTRALQRVYELSWGLPRMGIRGTARGLIWLLGFVAYLVLISTAVRVGTGVAATVVRTVLLVTSAILLWWWTPYVLLSGRVRARALLPSGLLTATVMLVVGRVSNVVVPRTIRNNERHFGTIGVVFAVESWLVVVACALVGTVVVSAVVAQAGGPLGRLARGSADVHGWRRGAPTPTGH